MMNLWRIPVEEQTGKPLGPPEAMTNGVLGWSYAPSFSQDGRRMLFVAGGPRTWVERVPFDARKEAVTGEGVRIAEGEQPRIVGNLVAFQPTGPSEDLAVMSPDGTGRRKLTDDVFRDRMFRASPDGQRIAFASDRGGALDLWLIGVDGTMLKQLTQMAPIASPVWSPDGKRMAGCQFTKGTFLLDPSRSWNEQTPEALPPLPGPDQLFCVLDWSPDGRLLVGFAIGPQGPTSGTWTWSFETREYRRYDTPGSASAHRWLSDSRRVLFLQDSTIMMLDTGDNRLHPVLQLAPDKPTEIFVTPDDQWIYFSRYLLEGDIWMATLRER
jgi:Tol biopolymer transport system component